MSKIILLSGPDKRKGFTKELGKELQSSFKDITELVCISGEPSNYEKNDNYINGKEDSLGLIKMFAKVRINIKFVLIEENKWIFELVDRLCEKRQF